MLQPRKVAEGRPLADAHHPRVGKGAGVQGCAERRHLRARKQILDILACSPDCDRARIGHLPTEVDKHAPDLRLAACQLDVLACVEERRWGRKTNPTLVLKDTRIPSSSARICARGSNRDRPFIRDGTAVIKATVDPGPAADLLEI